MATGSLLMTTIVMSVAGLCRVMNPRRSSGATMFWRKRAWDIAGGIDPSFQFALDWDLLARFQQAGCRMVRIPYFLGAFRVHPEQKTSQAIHTTGADEMRRIRTRFHGERQDDFDTINRHARHARFWGALTARLHEVGLR